MGDGGTPRPVTFDPSELTDAQRTGLACVLCHKRWPRPRAVVGSVPAAWPSTPDGGARANQPVLACEDCAAAIEHAVVSASRDERVPRPRRRRLRRRRWLPRVPAR